jgi:hypothetical protein
METLILKGTGSVDKLPIDIEVRFSLGETGPMLIEFVEKLELEDDVIEGHQIDNYIEPDDVVIPREELGKLRMWLYNAGF